MGNSLWIFLSCDDRRKHKFALRLIDANWFLWLIVFGQSLWLNFYPNATKKPLGTTDGDTFRSGDLIDDSIS